LFCKYQTSPFYEDKYLACVEDIFNLDSSLAENREVDEMSLALVQATDKAMTLKSRDTDAVLYKGSAKSGSEYFAARSFQGLNPDYENPLPQSYVVGRKGRAACYKEERNLSMIQLFDSN
jgi:diphthamide biosynthesis protein 2